MNKLSHCSPFIISVLPRTAPPQGAVKKKGLYLLEKSELH